MGILKDTVNAGIGFASLTRKKAEEVVDALITAGELTQSQKKEAVMELLSRAETGAKEYKNRLAEEMKEGIAGLGLAKKSELDALNRRLDDLAAEVAELRKKVAGAG